MQNTHISIELPSTEYLRQCFCYNPDNGELYWLHRPEDHFSNRHGFRVFNGSFAGNKAGSFDQQMGYTIVRLDGVKYKAHRVIFKYWYGEEPEIIDHINHERNDNRISNLRSVTIVQNAKHRKPKQAADTNVPQSGVMGINWDSNAQRWKVRIWDAKQKKHINHGRHKTLEQAINALNEATGEK